MWIFFPFFNASSIFNSKFADEFILDISIKFVHDIFLNKS